VVKKLYDLKYNRLFGRIINTLTQASSLGTTPTQEVSQRLRGFSQRFEEKNEDLLNPGGMASNRQCSQDTATDTYK